MTVKDFTVVCHVNTHLFEIYSTPVVFHKKVCQCIQQGKSEPIYLVVAVEVLITPFFWWPPLDWKKAMVWTSGHLDFLIAHEYLSCHDTETSLCGKVTHLNRVILSSRAWFCACTESSCRTGRDGFHVAVFVTEYTLLNNGTGIWYGILSCHTEKS